MMLAVGVRNWSPECRSRDTRGQKGKSATEEAVRAKLLETPHWDFGDVSCQFVEGVLTLRGRVRSFYVKQMAQELVRPMAVVEQIVNQLQVVSSGTR